MTVRNRKGFNRVIAGLAATVLVMGAIAQAMAAPIVLKEGEEISGYIRNTSAKLRFRNQAKSGAPTETAIGEEYTFTAQKGDTIEISVDPEEGSTLRSTLVLINAQGKQVGYDTSFGLLKYRVPLKGKYKLLVLAQGNTRGRYVVTLAGISASPTQVAEADSVMTNVLQLRVIGCGVPNVALIKIGSAERCTRDIEPGQYVYDATTKRIALIDTRRELLAQRLQITMLEKCPSPATSVVQIVTQDTNGKDYIYCATPNRYVSAGTYRYDMGADKLTPVTTTATTPPTPGTPTPTTTNPDPRRDLLQQDYGLTVLANCPAARTSLVIVNFPEANQVYTYCANPNRLVKAGEYVYNTEKDALEVAKKTPDCTLLLGGVCIVK